MWTERALKAGSWLIAMWGFGWLMPDILGAAFFDAALLLCYALFALLFVAPVVCDAAESGEPARPAMLRGAAFGFASSFALTAVRVVAVNRQFHAPEWLLPEPSVVVAMAVFTAVWSWFSAALSLWLTRRLGSAGAARQRIRTGFFIAALVAVIANQYGPDSLRLAFGQALGPGRILWWSAAVSALLVAASRLWGRL
ncbi:MAG: hypothetical protein U0Q16_07000 [Bryobacteraceae bacterium]